MEESAGFAEVYGERLYYQIGGEGDAVVLLHGGMLDLRQWDEQIGALTRSYRVLRYDARGYGRSPLGGEPYSHHEDLAALLRELGIERAHLVALSNGSTIALDTAVAFPSIVRSLAIGPAPMTGYDLGAEFTASIRGILEAGAAGDSEQTRRRLWGFAPLHVAGSIPAVRERVDGMIVSDYSFAHVKPSAPARMRVEPPAATRLDEIRAPTLVVAGDGEMPVLLDQARFLARGIPGARLCVVAGAGHVVNMERPAEYERVILDWLEEVG